MNTYITIHTWSDWTTNALQIWIHTLQYIHDLTEQQMHYSMLTTKMEFPPVTVQLISHIYFALPLASSSLVTTILFFALCVCFCSCFFWLWWVFAVQGLSLAAASRDYSLLCCTGFPLRCLLLLQSIGSRHTGFSGFGLWALKHSFGSCGACASLLHSIWDLPRPGIKPASLVLQADS